MMIKTGNMNFFKINRCGLYKVGSEKSFSLELAETFQTLMDWRKPLTMASSIPWPPSYRTNKSKCYCREIYKDDITGDFLVILWKSDTDTTGSLFGAAEDSIDGSDEVIKYGNEKNGIKVIWGRPCYYWVVADENLVVSIKFDHSVCDADLFQEYVTACITKKVEHPDKKVAFTKTRLVRLSFADDVSDYRYSYRFDMSLKQLSTLESDLVSLANNVTHIVQKETLLLKTATDQRAYWVKLFDKKIPLLKSKNEDKFRQIEIRAEAKPTAAEIKKIIESFYKAKESPEDNIWDNVGFETKTETIWAETFRVKNQISVASSEGKVYSAKFLLGEIQKKRAEYLSPLKEEKAKKVSIKKTTAKA